jgi:tripartite ATP-independent transporter DctM subunit
VDFSYPLFGRLRGGLAQVNIVTSIIFGGISGSAAADMAALGKVFIPSMTKEGYDKSFSTAVTAASSVLSPIIPPSVVMVIYGALMGVSIAGMFAAGIVPGLLIAGTMMVITRIISGKRSYPKHAEALTLSRIVQATKGAIWALILPAIILGGILGGLVTPTEAGAVAVGYTLLLGFLIYRSLSFRALYRLLLDGSVMMGVVGLLFCSAAVMSWLLTSEQIPQTVTKLFLSITTNKYLILLLMNILLLIIGMFIDIISAIILLGPILEPLALALGVHPLHFGMMMCVNLNMAMITPPIGGSLFIAMVVSDLSLGEILRELWPFILVQLFVLFLIVYIPDITMFFPRILGIVG